jgi:dihydropteroate synthase
MHSKGSPETMQENPYYDDVAGEVLTFFIKGVAKLKRAGLTDIIIDPGFGFGKNNSRNYTLLKNLKMFQMLECPILAGISRKSMVTKILNLKPSEALNGTTALQTIALLNGTSILRVHDVPEAIQVRRIVGEYLNT